ncbi:hypothetical protein PV703_12840 [Streptomyces sp. ME01-24h]|nr:hypothetical protein [Streptomyces sp. ME01-24h]
MARNLGLPKDHGDWGVPYQPADFLDLDREAIPLRGKAPAPALVDFVRELITAEGPIHEQVLFLHVREVLHLNTLSPTRKQLVQAAVEQLVEKGDIASDGEFLDLPDRACRFARWPLPGLTQRPVEHVAPKERQTAILGLIRDTPGISFEDVVPETIRFFGWSARTQGVKSSLVADLYRLRDHGHIVGWPNQLTVPGSHAATTGPMG